MVEAGDGERAAQAAAVGRGVDADHEDLADGRIVVRVDLRPAEAVEVPGPRSVGIRVEQQEPGGVEPRLRARAPRRRPGSGCSGRGGPANARLFTSSHASSSTPGRNGRVAMAGSPARMLRLDRERPAELEQVPPRREPGLGRALVVLGRRRRHHPPLVGHPPRVATDRAVPCRGDGATANTEGPGPGGQRSAEARVPGGALRAGPRRRLPAARPPRSSRRRPPTCA